MSEYFLATHNIKRKIYSFNLDYRSVVRNSN